MGKYTSFFALALSLVLSAALIACSGGGGASTTTPPPTQAATTTSLALSGNTAAVGVSVTLTATVTSGGAAVTAGSVTFYDGATNLGVVSLDSTGKAAWSSASFAAGAHTLTASYGGTSSYSASSSSAATLTVSVPLQQSSLVLSASQGNVLQGQPVEFFAKSEGLGGTGLPIPTGTVTFSNGANALGVAALDSTGTAIFTSTRLPVGVDNLTATYNGDGNYAPVTGPISVTVSASAASTFTNPLKLNVSANQQAVSCADPAIYKDQSGGVDTWYLYCTSDALYAGDPATHYLSIYRASDLVNWTYVGEAFNGLPSWAKGSGAMLWAPAIKYFNGQYYLYYAASASNLAGNGAAIGVGTAATPAGPFVDSGAPVVAPAQATNCCGGAYRSTIDPDEIQDAAGQRYILFGSFTGGIYVRKLSADGLTSDPTSEQQIAVDNRYEGGNWWFHNGYYYLFASSTNCCNGPLSGYGVFVGRASTPMGPYLDAQGIAMTATNAGGTPVLKMNGNSVIGPGGNVVFTDEAGQDYLLYHGIVSSAPYYSNNIGYTARPGYIDPLDWVNGWPVARGGFGPSDLEAPQPMPAAQPGASNAYVATTASQDVSRSAIAALSDEFNSASLGSQWSFVHTQPAYTLTGTAYQAPTVGADTTNAMAQVPLLAEAAPAGDYMIETKLDLTLPVSGTGADFAQAGLLIYGDDNDYLRLDLYSNNDTRQVEFIKAATPAAQGYPSWGATNLGAPAIGSDVNVWLRIVKRNVNGEEHYTAYSSNDNVNWIQGGVWVHHLGTGAKLCLYAGNRAGYTASFDYVHVSTLQ